MPLVLDRQFSFDNFVSRQPALVVDSLQALIGGQGETQIGVWGTNATGKTHLLNASAASARGLGQKVQIYDAWQLVESEALGFTDFDQCDLLIVDNLDAVAGRPDWERVFYQIINRCRANEFKLIFALCQNPAGLSTSLDDFRSRLQWGLLLQLPTHSDIEIRQILIRRAELLGIGLSDEVVSYLLNHRSRNLAAQMSILQQLDIASMTEQRKVTIPLIKQALDGG